MTNDFLAWNSLWTLEAKLTWRSISRLLYDTSSDAGTPHLLPSEGNIRNSLVVDRQLLNIASQR